MTTDDGELAHPRRQEAEQDEPEGEQKMPVDAAQLHAQSHLAQIQAAPYLLGGHSQGHKAAQQVQSVRTGEQIEEGVRRVGRQEIACSVELEPRHELPEQERQGEEASCNQAIYDVLNPSPARRNVRVLQRDTAQDQHACVEPQEPRRGNFGPVRHLHSHEVGADEERKQRADNGEEHAQADRRCRQGRGACVRDIADRPDLQPGLGRQPLL